MTRSPRTYPRAANVQLNVRVTRELKQLLEDAARDRGVPMVRLIEQSVRAFHPDKQDENR